MALKLSVNRLLRRLIIKKLGIDFELGDYKIGEFATIESPCNISNAIDLRGMMEIGAFTTISPTDSIGKLLHNVKFGRYCSVAAGTWCSPHEYPISWLTTSPIGYEVNSIFGRFPRKEANKIPCFSPSKPVYVGNDVWIGSGVFIKGGVTIGDGAVIGAHAVVTKDIPPYAIVGGVPAKILRFRFDGKTIARLQELQWWKYDVFQIPNLDFANVHHAIDIISRAINDGLKPYTGRQVTYRQLKRFCGRLGVIKGFM